MALISCPECKNEISDKAVACPNCGCPASEWRAFSITSSVRKGDVVALGSYPYTKHGLKAPIEWIVLSKRNNKVQLISKCALDARPFNVERKNVTWENCTLRTWLNMAFYNEAFNDNEKSHIVQTNVKGGKNIKGGISNGNDTVDKVFLLSVAEAEKILNNPKIGTCVPTEYAFAQGTKTADCVVVEGKVACCLWSRSASCTIRPYAYAVAHSSSISNPDIYKQKKIVRANALVTDRNAIRPVVWVEMGE